MLLQQNFSNAMTVIKAARRLSITDFSAQADVSRSTMQNILKESCNLRMDTVEHIAEHLGVHPAVLLFPGYSNSQLEFALLLLDTLEVFSNLPKSRQLRAARLLYHLIRLLCSDK